MAERYEREIKRVEGLKPYSAPARATTTCTAAATPNLFKAFGERFMHLCRTSGAVGCVLPRPLVVGAGSEALRREYFTGWAVQSVDMVSPTLELPTVPNPRAAAVFEKMLQHPR